MSSYGALSRIQSTIISLSSPLKHLNRNEFSFISHINLTTTSITNINVTNMLKVYDQFFLIVSSQFLSISFLTIKITLLLLLLTFVFVAIINVLIPISLVVHIHHICWHYFSINKSLDNSFHHCKLTN